MENGVRFTNAGGGIVVYWVHASDGTRTLAVAFDSDQARREVMTFRGEDFQTLVDQLNAAVDAMP
jgi:hypothetical protein